MGSFTQGGIALGQSLGGGIENYVAGRERRELLVGKALGIQDQLRRSNKRTDEDNNFLKKFDDVNELGTRQLQSLISEFETGEELQMMDMKRRLASAQTKAAEAKVASMKGLGDFTRKGMPETEAGFEGDAWAVPEYLTRDYLEGDRGQRDIAAGAFPGDYKPIYEEREISGGGDDPEGLSEFAERALMGAPEENPYLDEIDRRLAEDDAWLNRALAEEKEAARNPNLLGIRNLEPKHPWESGGRLEALKRAGASRAKKDLYNTTQNLKEKYKNIKGLDSYLEGELFKEDVLEPYKMPLPDVASAPLEVEQPEAGEPAAEEPAAEAPRRTSRELVGYDTSAREPQVQPLDRYAATGGTPATPTDERRGQLIDSLAQYNLTPADRKQAIEMISEKYPKLKEIATGVESPDGKALGFKVGNTFIPARQSVGAAGAGGDDLELTSVTVNDKGEVTRIMKPKEGLKESQKTLLANAKEFKHQAEKLLETVNSHGGWESSLSAAFSDASAKAKADLDSLSYRMAILYSKIVDPATAAREGEVVAAKKYAFPMGFWTPNEVTKAAVNSMLEEVMRRESDFYEQEGMENPQAQEAGAATNPADELGIL